jgi:hypothetical protein
MASTPNLLGQEVSNSVLLAAQYGVSPKTIRDIWNRKTWISATADLYEKEQTQTINLANFQYLNLKVSLQIAFLFVRLANNERVAAAVSADHCGGF